MTKKENPERAANWTNDLKAFQIVYKFQNLPNFTLQHEHRHAAVTPPELR